MANRFSGKKKKKTKVNFKRKNLTVNIHVYNLIRIHKTKAETV